MNSEKRHALVTGAGRGIGRAIAFGLAKEGIRVAVNYHNRSDMAEEAVRKIREAGGEAFALAGDVRDDDQVKSMVERVVKEWGSIEILVNNAAIHRGGRVQDLSIQDWNTALTSALYGSFYCCRHVVPLMLKKGWGRIVNVSSYVALHGYPGDAAYGAAKAGLIGFTLSLAKETAAKGITANVIVPGYVPTDTTASLFDTDEKVERAIRDIPMKRAGSPEEVAEMVTFLALKGDYITGAVMRVDGGLAM